MSKLQDRTYLTTQQYRDASNLNARIQLHERFSTNPYGWQRWVFDQFDLPAQSRILELGGGAGRLWLENLDRIPAGWKITLSDLSTGMLADARRNLEASGRPFRYEVIDAQSIPFEDARFDAVIANHVLFHVPDRPKALSEIRRVLKPGGALYATTVGAAHLGEIGELVSRFDPNIPESNFAATFTLDNGLAQLSPWFPKVELRRYEDALVVTEAGPLVAYVLSSSRSDFVVDGDRRAEFTRFVERELAVRGSINVTKDSGMFVAYRRSVHAP